ncbi:MAG: aminopeptidase P family protein [Aquificae bacterium]|nr:aminopeptidase P family protein [Aquificota bacterium]
MKTEEVLQKIKREGLDAFVFSSQPSVFYLTGFRSTHAYAVLGSESRLLITDGRYYERAKEELPDWEVLLIKGKPLRFLKKTLRERGLRLVGYEEDRVSCSLRKALRSSRIRWRGYSDFLKEFRMLKTKEELRKLKEGVKRTDEVFRKVLGKVREGMTELELRGLIVKGFFDAGGEGESFPAIVASGPHSAVPHWETSRSPIEKGVLLIDMGMLWEGYCTDFTRTLYLGKPTEEFKRVFGVVRDAHLFALEKVKVGNRVGDVDRAAREYIEKKGFGKFFTHSTGHGIGVEIHEPPRLYHRGDDAEIPIEEGMVFTVEPGIYLPGEFGVRLENIVAVEKGRGEPLSGIPLDLPPI